MNINVDYIDSNGTQQLRNYTLSRLAFAKHMAIAGQEYSPQLNKLFRALGMFLQYSPYIQRSDFNQNRFSEPPMILSDPTEKAQFSNLAGKAIADYLSKKIDNSLFTVNYEAAMRVLNFPIKGSRPDLIAFSSNSIFAVEAKGKSKNSSGNMSKHKAQSLKGPIIVNFTVASVSYNLFNQVKCKYHDPVNKNVPYDNITLRALSRNYYAGLLQYLNEKFFDYGKIQIQGEPFYEVKSSYRTIERLLKNERKPAKLFRFLELFDIYEPSLILPNNIEYLAKEGLNPEQKAFKFEESKKRNIYIDNDRVGLRIKR